MTKRRVRRFISTCPPFFVSRHAAISEAARAYFGSASCLSPKRLAVILEAPRAYFGSASCLSPKRLVVISEAPCGYFALCRGFGGHFIINNDVNVCLIAFV